MILLIYKDAGGIWHQDKFRPLTVSVVNLIFSIILVNIAGIYGILASTFIATIIIGTPWLINNLFTTIFDRNQMAGYLKKLIYYAAVTAAICMVFYIVCGYINAENLYLEFLIKILVCLLSNVFFFIFYFRLPEFQKLKNILKRVVGVQAQNWLEIWCVSSRHKKCLCRAVSFAWQQSFLQMNVMLKEFYLLLFWLPAIQRSCNSREVFQMCALSLLRTFAKAPPGVQYVCA